VNRPYTRHTSHFFVIAWVGAGRCSRAWTFVIGCSEGREAGPDGGYDDARPDIKRTLGW